MTSAQRAAMNLHNTYGDRAGPQIAELQQGGLRHGPMPPQVSHQGPYIKQEDTSSDHHRLHQPQQPAPLKSDQTDGAGDDRDAWQFEHMRRKANTAENRERNDHLIRERVSASQQQLEGGGVLLPLDQHAHIVPRPAAATLGQEGTSSLQRAQGDAAGDDDDDDDGDDDEEDEDAINSELDDPEEAEDDVNNEDSTDQVMLCTYDKVQRVKNKWKCTLKDGILRVDGSEILFHKGSGEFEW